ncbi:MAG: molybdopterin adenylyltransferase [Planctomycetota bacterium]
MSQPALIGVVTVSDRASRGEYEDCGGPEVVRYLQEKIQSDFEWVGEIIPDEQSLIENALIHLCDEAKCPLIITTGGTGPALRDVTPEATESVCQKMLAGFGEAMRAVSLTKVATAILSRQTAGIRRSGSSASLIVNLPGSPKAIAECLDAVFPAIPYCIDLIGGPKFDSEIAFRPKKK